MPLRRDVRHFYRGPVWADTRARILARAENRCECCGKPNGAIIWTVVGNMLNGGTTIPYTF